MRISFHGAARGVTGSCHLVECGGKRLLIDCGLYQGGRELEEENRDPFGFDPADLDFLLLTHAHLDHCGRIPLLVKRGFRGEIITTPASRELARLVLLDSAHIQEEHAFRRRRKAARHGDKDAVEPLYQHQDVLDSFDRFGREAQYDSPLEVADGIQATYLDAGHILGSAVILLRLKEGPRRCSVLFSGDLGQSGRPILRDPAPAPSADVVVMESTYGDRSHQDIESSAAELYQAIAETFGRGGNVVIPTFALERAQEILYFLREGVSSGRLARDIQVFLDSPMAISATQIFEKHPECYDEETRALFRRGQDPFHFAGVHFTRLPTESMAINDIRKDAVIMAGSGMCTGGRVRFHLEKHLPQRRSSIIFVGFAAHGTPARWIIDGASEVSLFGRQVPVRAAVHTINGFSAHADQAELIDWHRRTGAATTFLVHGESEAMHRLALQLDGTRIEMPSQHQSVDLHWAASPDPKGSA